jgi:hypothetical protein
MSSPILYSTNPDDARVEADMRQWYRDNFGEEDTRVLLDWLWDHNGKNGVRFVDALVHIAKETQIHGKQFVHNLLEVAKKPKHVREAEVEILAWAKPRLEKAAAVVMGHRGNPDVKRQEFDAFLHALEDKLWNMYPSKHRATMKGAILSAFQDVNGKTELRVSDLVKALNLEDPLAATAGTAGRR